MKTLAGIPSKDNLPHFLTDHLMFPMILSRVLSEMLVSSLFNSLQRHLRLRDRVGRAGSVHWLAQLPTSAAVLQGCPSDAALGSFGKQCRGRRCAGRSREPVGRPPRAQRPSAENRRGRSVPGLTKRCPSRGQPRGLKWGRAG